MRNFVDPEHFVDPHIYTKDGQPLPWHLPDSQRPWKSNQPRGAFIWPRDKGVTNSPPGSWRRFKDIITGKGPGIWIGDRTEFGPTKPEWSNWLEYDNLGYWHEHNEAGGLNTSNGDLGDLRYDFRTRKYKVPDRHTWSDAKWERRKHPVYHHYHRKRNGQEWSDLGPWQRNNPFRYDRETHYMDWARPSNDDYYYQVYMPYEFEGKHHT